jgi:3'-phosphoadenosine 5'-phosphosulfate sulfotransferase (PAPS reductase)/FAD synthetase
LRILSFGAGVQTTALAILAYQGKVQFDRAIFADTGAEKPETYWYMENYTKPLFEKMGMTLEIVKAKEQAPEYYYRTKGTPNVMNRMCSSEFKVRPMAKVMSKEDIRLIGFSSDEGFRVERAKFPEHKSFPLYDLHLSGEDCHHIISDYGWPVPIKSSCYFCPFQSWSQWNWLKNIHPELIKRAVEMEMRFYEKKPNYKQYIGLYGGKPLWKFAEGQQLEWEFPGEYSCWNGYCGH